jgi:hypothetical protein
VRRVPSITDGEEAKYGELIERVDRIAALLALTLVQGLERVDKIRALDAVGYTPQQIGKLIGIRPNTVSVFLTRSRQKATRRKKASSRRKPSASKGAKR